MNLVFLFLSRSDLNSIPRIKNWLNEMGKVDNLVAFVNPHLAIDPSEDQVSLENRILSAVQATIVHDSERMSLELTLQKRWMQIPREVMLEQFDKIFEPFGLSTNMVEKTLILSWAIKGQGGHRHINEKNADEIVPKLQEFGFWLDVDKTNKWRELAGDDLSWFKHSIYCFERIV